MMQLFPFFLQFPATIQELNEKYNPVKSKLLEGDKVSAANGGLCKAGGGV
jgi:hypothetical protein